jgi:hypothetical protein
MLISVSSGSPITSQDFSEKAPQDFISKQLDKQNKSDNPAADAKFGSLVFKAN